MAKFRRSPNNNAAASGGMFSTLSNDLQAAFLEFCGTFIFLFFGLGGIQTALATTALQDSQQGIHGGIVRPAFGLLELLYGSASLGLSLLIAVWLFYRVTGGIFNPNVSTALLLVGVIGPVRWALYCIAQLLGAIGASAVIMALVPGPLVFQTYPGQGVNKAQAVFFEMFMTATLILSVLMLAAEKHMATPFAPVGIGLTLFACELFGFNYSGGSLNTARSFGPAVVSGFHNTHWIYWVGPFLGTLLASGFYIILKRVQYWSLVDPPQDSINPEHSPDDPIASAAGRPSTATTAVGKNDPANNV